MYPWLREHRRRPPPGARRCADLEPNRPSIAVSAAVLLTVPPTPLERYERAAWRSSAVVIAEYSTSFGLATRLLRPTTRRHIRDVYALVRLADEVVDGVAAESGLGPDEVAAALDALEADTYRAMASGYS